MLRKYDIAPGFEVDGEFKLGHWLSDNRTWGLQQKTLEDYTRQLKDDQQSDYEPLADLISSTNEVELEYHFGLILSLSLQLLEHHRVNNQLKGIRCVEHMVKTVSLNTLRSRGADNLFIKSLQLRLYSNDPQMLEKILPAVLTVFKTCQVDPMKAEDYRCDDAFHCILSNLEMTSDNLVSKATWLSIPSFIDFMGAASVKYTKRLVHLFSEQLSFPLRKDNLVTIIRVLKAVQRFFINTPDGIFNFLPDLYLSLFKYLYANFEELTTNANNTELLDNVIACFEQLMKKDSATYTDLSQVVTQTNDKKSLECLKVIPVAY